MNKYIQGYIGTWVLEYRDTDYRNIVTQGYRDKPYRIIEIRHTRIQRGTKDYTIQSNKFVFTFHSFIFSFINK